MNGPTLIPDICLLCGDRIEKRFCVRCHAEYGHPYRKYRRPKMVISPILTRIELKRIQKIYIG